MRERFRIGPLAFTAALALAAAAGPAGAAEHRVPEDFETINAAIAEAEWGDEILVSPGIYEESIVLTDEKGDGLILRAVSGPAETTLKYAEAGNQNEAVVTIQRCSNSTQIVGFTIDGRQAARRGILVNSGSKPVLVDLLIDGCEYGIASHRNSRPYVQNVKTLRSITSGLYVQGGSADVKDCSFTIGDKFGVYIRGTGDPVRLRNCIISDNGQVGLQASDGDFEFHEGTVENNGDTGIILQDTAPIISDVIVANHANVGIVMDAAEAIIRNCAIRNNEFGMVISIEGQPKIFHCTFQDNVAYHIGVEGAAMPIIGGSPANANRFLGEPSYAVQSASTGEVTATHNYWDKPCAPGKIFKVTNGKLKKKPWMTPDLLHPMEDCEEARKYYNKWQKGKLPEQSSQEASATAAERRAQG